jgi:anaerobic selenocysteine-containing dehydrogenase
LGKKLGSVHLASLWGTLQNLAMAPFFQDMTKRVGFNPGPALGEEIFQSIIENPQGLFIGEVDETAWDHFQAIATKDGRIHLDVPEMEQWIKEIDPAMESEKLEKDKKEFPFVMSAGRHWDVNANTQMRDPEWNKGRRACTMTMHPDDAKGFGFSDGQMARVITEAGEEVIEIEVTDTTRPGYIVIPHGFGLVFQGKTFTANANRLAKNTHRDRIAATPLHRYVPCRVEPI